MTEMGVLNGAEGSPNCDRHCAVALSRHDIFQNGIAMRIRTFYVLLCFAAVSAFAFAAAQTARAEQGAPLVVVELYTSQGCSSCPAADAFLGELIEMRDDILGLEFHVDYWDNLGWKDRFSSVESTVSAPMPNPLASPMSTRRKWSSMAPPTRSAPTRWR